MKHLLFAIAVITLLGCKKEKANTALQAIGIQTGHKYTALKYSPNGVYQSGSHVTFNTATTITEYCDSPYLATTMVNYAVSVNGSTMTLSKLPYWNSQGYYCMYSLLYFTGSVTTTQKGDTIVMQYHNGGNTSPVVKLVY